MSLQLAIALLQEPFSRLGHVAIVQPIELSATASPSVQLLVEPPHWLLMAPRIFDSAFWILSVAAVSGHVFGVPLTMPSLHFWRAFVFVWTYFAKFFAIACWHLAGSPACAAVASAIAATSADATSAKRD